MATAGVSGLSKAVLPDEMIAAIEDCGFFESISLWAVTIIGSMVVTVLSFVAAYNKEEPLVVCTGCGKEFVPEK